METNWKDLYFFCVCNWYASYFTNHALEIALGQILNLYFYQSIFIKNNLPTVSFKASWWSEWHVKQLEALASLILEIDRKLTVHKSFRKRKGCLLNLLCTFILRPVFRGFRQLLGFLYIISSWRFYYSLYYSLFDTIMI